MAKAKKTTDETTPASEGAEPKKPAAPKKKAPAPKAAAAAETAAAPTAEAKKAPAKKPAPAKPTPTPASFGFGIDTNLAAQNAARMLLNRSSSPSAPTTTGTVKHLKDSLNKPASSLSNLLGGSSSTGGKASNLPHFSSQQKSHNQSTGPVGNTGVPRRTPG